jgi:hypothetical protein
MTSAVIIFSIGLFFIIQSSMAKLTQEEIREDMINRALLCKMEEFGVDSILIKELDIQNIHYGARYHTRAPILKKFLIVEEMDFLNVPEYVNLSPDDQEGVLAMKKKLITPRIFSMEYHNVFVENIIVNQISYGLYILTG